MSKVRGASKVGGVKSKLAAFVAIVIGFISLGLAPAYAVDERVIDVVAVTWAGAAAPAGDAKKVASVIDTEVNADWKSFTTMYGDTKDRTVSFKTGRVLETPISLVSKMACSGIPSSEFMRTIRPEAYSRLGISNSSERYLVVVAPKAGCVWSGRALVGGANSTSGTLILHDTASSFVITHELGHNFGLGHSNFLRCDSGANDGAWGETCKGVEYGGTIDVMGNVDTRSPLNTYHQWRMGYIEDSQIKQVWQSEIVNLAPSDFANGIKAIYIRDGNAAYWIEYRRKLEGVGYKPGLAIYRLDPPPVSAIVSPNPEDTSTSEFPLRLGSDVWMLNLDTYVYKDSRSVGGSMTGLTASTFSGDVSFSAVASETGAVVTIKKKVDATAPPVPNVVPVDQWRSPGMSILKLDAEDADTAIVGYETQIDGILQNTKASDVEGWFPTYLSPFTTPKTLYMRDLPEGTYSLAVRAIDLVGNKSDWSTPVRAVIDRGEPVVTNDFQVSAVSSTETTLQWKGATDSGSGICEVAVVDSDGLIIQSSKIRNAPALKVGNTGKIEGTVQVFDCIGNGLTGDLSIKNSFVSAEKSSRSGKWSSVATQYGAGAIRCFGKCSASITVLGKNQILMGPGSASIAVGNKVVANVSDSKIAKLRVGTVVDVGSTKKVVRISGSNFVLIGASSLAITLGSLTEVDRTPAKVDDSLSDPKQAVLAKYGFRSDDFSHEWSIAPMPNGTTLLDPSLDLCNGTFNSERDRIERRQVTALKEQSIFSFLSTEVVRYSSAANATAAQKELVLVLAKCQSEKGYSAASGEKIPYEFKAIKNVPTGVVSEGNRVFVHAVIDSGDRARTLLGFYQFNGDLFTGLYVLNTKGFTDADVAKWLKVAVTMAERLRGKPA
jgi:hypothetical protein